MSRRPQLVRLVGACLSLLIGTVFCQQFSRFQFNALVRGAGYPPEELPTLCIWFLRYTPMLMVLPLMMLWIGATLLLRRKGPSGTVELCIQTALVLALVLIVVCILAWQVPYAPPLGESF